MDVELVRFVDESVGQNLLAMEVEQFSIEIIIIYTNAM